MCFCGGSLRAILVAPSAGRPFVLSGLTFLPISRLAFVACDGRQELHRGRGIASGEEAFPKSFAAHESASGSYAKFCQQFRSCPRPKADICCTTEPEPSAQEESLAWFAMTPHGRKRNNQRHQSETDPWQHEYPGQTGAGRSMRTLRCKRLPQADPV